jgi:hypothetical protein
MSKVQILDLIYTGTLLKYPEIIGALSYEYYYSLIDQDFHTVYGYELLNLWVTGKLSYNFVQAEYSTDEESKRDIDDKMRERIGWAIHSYISGVLQEYRIHHRKVCYLTSHSRSCSSLDHKNDSYRDLFLRMEKAMYLYRVAVQFLPDKIDTEMIQTDFSIEYEYTFSDELLIPTPLYMPIQT